MIHILEDIDRWTCEYKECKAKCCTPGIPLTIADIKRITALGYSLDDFLELDEINKAFRIKGREGRCFFLGNELECTIRENEPLVCRLLPFKIADVSYSDEPILRLKPVVNCPGEGRGKKIDNRRIETDAISFLHENQKLIRDIKKKGTKGLLEEFSG
ncbi:putative Fe-S oxidoreductase [Candidatus Methanoperedens nitroreducens]|uniref:Putative Fe-S oxidoreductase n=1 Tax=Candidatus Methanoperedens nitratireducens TaxID=1392998 RepID=A0A062UYT3_9EURY|nr:YkgJ family cysteine cluster protein [Candidatus Methanoperedens nitroreducens]KCZ72091.1 putative Fe-S oxidoreductase [Candidatus Methanoperedens nitroreducens]MDJ1421930.1 YkgJ family cysteine cluster protein [Candidatus Methanoperedens sp.]